MFPQWHLPWINMRAISVIAAPDINMSGPRRAEEPLDGSVRLLFHRRRLNLGGKYHHVATTASANREYPSVKAQAGAS